VLRDGANIAKGHLDSIQTDIHNGWEDDEVTEWHSDGEPELELVRASRSDGLSAQTADETRTNWRSSESDTDETYETPVVDPGWVRAEDLRPGLLQDAAGVPQRAGDPQRRLMLRILASDHAHDLLVAALSHPAMLLAAPAHTLAACLACLGQSLGVSDDGASGGGGGGEEGTGVGMRMRTAESVHFLTRLLLLGGHGLPVAAAAACLTAAVPAIDCHVTTTNVRV